MTFKTIYERAALFGRTCQSPRTGFVHLFNGTPGGDMIPVYENFCFALSLIRQKTAEGVLEGKELLERLFGFQAPAGLAWEGNFPIYLHDFPRCWNPLQTLRIAPLLVHLLRDFAHVLSEEFRHKTSAVLQKLLSAATKRREQKSFEPLWERRYLALHGQEVPFQMPQGSQDAAEELITLSLQSKDPTPLIQLVHPTLKAYVGPSPHEAQERGEPSPTLLGWWGGCEGFSQHPLQLELAALPLPSTSASLWSGEAGEWRVRQFETLSFSFAVQTLAGRERLAARLLWKEEEKTHSLVLRAEEADVSIEEKSDGLRILFQLPEKTQIDRNDLFEVELFCNLSESTKLSIEDQKGMVFRLGETVSIKTPGQDIDLRFNLAEGEGDYCGHLLRSNRPFQTACKGSDIHEAFDWKIGLRTLRRSQRATLSLLIFF